MIDWYNSLNLLQRIFALIAIPSTVVLLIQTVMLFFGLGDSGGDVDIDGDGMPDSIADGDGGLALFSIRGIMTMLCVGSWSGIAISQAGVNSAITVILAVIIGFAALEDVNRAAERISAKTYNVWMPLIAAAIIYYIVIKTLTVFLRKLERRLRKSDVR